MSTIVQTRPTFPLSIVMPKCRRRTATAVMAGDFDPRPQRDALTSLLNGVKPYTPRLTEEQMREKEELRLKRKEQKRGKEKEMGPKVRHANTSQNIQDPSVDARRVVPDDAPSTVDHPQGGDNESRSKKRKRPGDGMSSFWMASSVRTASSMINSPEHTPEPSDHSDYSSRSSSKRPHTPEDDLLRRSASTDPRLEVDEDELPKDKLIELDSVPILQERRTRSGKNFDAIGEGHDTWVSRLK
ncbi:hypothetical protein SISSUDRAFT_245667 [Sistotremastrum suecicum HHB10207 ss-3]|uniref:Uncharacterized protein n=1 Tax=Sistotremastrum suecicum HHB10207 ss-3 TaxID=1314776 RepID=A0A165ZYD7_9AGAM|nr:hypothetical protein SISSUDRAFT_245667 [Sistotremastrum suecicum HHB10207 ss-3]